MQWCEVGDAIVRFGSVLRGGCKKRDWHYALSGMQSFVAEGLLTENVCGTHVNVVCYLPSPLNNAVERFGSHATSSSRPMKNKNKYKKYKIAETLIGVRCHTFQE